MSQQSFMSINGQMVSFSDEKNVLEVIRNAGIDIPTLCYYSDLSIYGACRMCIVEDERGGIMTSCSTPPKDGMQVFTNTPKLNKHRRLILKMLLSSHCRECTTCVRGDNCSLQKLSNRFGITEVRFDKTEKAFKDEYKIDNSSKSIKKDPNKCIHCGDCVRVCSETQNVGVIDFAHRGWNLEVTTAFHDPLGETECVNCGQCVSVCPTAALTVKVETDKAWDAIYDKNKRTIVQVAPAVRVALGEMFGMETENVIPLINAALRKLGFDEVYDTSFSADLTVIEESEELLRKLANNETLPLFSSCCPGWVRYAENRHPELLPQLSTCKSPMEMFSAVVKEDATVNPDLQPDKREPYVVAIMPCTAKKFEASREEFVVDGQSRTDLVLTTKELGMMIRQAGIHFDELQPEAHDLLFGMYSGAGVIFGVTGGVTEAVIRRLLEDKSHLSLSNVQFLGVRGLEGVKELTLPYGERDLKIGIVSGLRNAENLIQKIKDGEVHYDFVEVMACPAGCINGGGQPRSSHTEREERAKALYSDDRLSEIRHSEANPQVNVAYQRIIKDNNHRLLHVSYDGAHHGMATE
jgi:NADH-quinone oxidoreductase subunit G